VRTESELAARRVQLEENDAESRRRVEASREAQRLTALQAEQTAIEADRKLEAMRQEQVAAEQQRMQAEADVARLNLELEDLRRQKDATIAMMEKTAEQRQAELASIETTRQDALAKLHTVETQKADLVSRESAHAAALQKQIEIEKAAQERAAHYRATGPR
jgi:hypothetical protein